MAICRPTIKKGMKKMLVTKEFRINDQTFNRGAEVSIRIIPDDQLQSLISNGTLAKSVDLVDHKAILLPVNKKGIKK